MKAITIRLDQTRTNKLVRLSERRQATPTRMATDLLVRALDSEPEAGRDEILSPAAEQRLRRLLTRSAGEPDGFSGTSDNGLPYSRVDIVIESIKEILGEKP